MEWQPIETAPKDQTRILVGWPNSESEIAFWYTISKEWVFDDGDYCKDPTHWMPLPDPPEATK